jgi:hypothetical protein
MIRRRAAAADILAPIGNRTFRATGITAYLSNGGALEHAQEMAAQGMIESGGEIIHAMFAEPGEVDRHNSRYAAERVFEAMMEAWVEAQPILRQPEPPPRLDQLEQEVMAANVPLDVLVGRETLRDLLRYVRRLEREMEEGGFWSRVLPCSVNVCHSLATVGRRSSPHSSGSERHRCRWWQTFTERADRELFRKAPRGK